MKNIKNFKQFNENIESNDDTSYKYNIGDYVILGENDDSYCKILSRRIGKCPIYKLEYYEIGGIDYYFEKNEFEIYRKLTPDEVEFFEARRAGVKYNL